MQEGLALSTSQVSKVHFAFIPFALSIVSLKPVITDKEVYAQARNRKSFGRVGTKEGRPFSHSPEEGREAT